MAVYADYEFYTDTYLGTAIAETDFPRFARDASADIDRLTFGRAAPIVTADEDDDTIALIQMATCAVADAMHALESTGGAIQFEMVGRHSISYASPLSASQRLAQAAARWLGGTGLLYRGFADGEYSGTLE